jgi:hypothetical protein
MFFSTHISLRAFAHHLLSISPLTGFDPVQMELRSAATRLTQNWYRVATELDFCFDFALLIFLRLALDSRRRTPIEIGSISHHVFCSIGLFASDRSGCGATHSNGVSSEKERSSPR